MTATAASGTYTAAGSPAYLDCVGTVGGALITGPASYTDTGTWRGNCAAGVASGPFEMHVPTTAGMRVVRGHVELVWVGAALAWALPVWSGTAQMVPVAGDCVRTPVTSARILGQTTLTA